MKKCVVFICMLGILMASAGCEKTGIRDTGKNMAKESESTVLPQTTNVQSGRLSNQKKAGNLKMLSMEENAEQFADKGGLYYIFTHENGVGTGWPCIRYVDYKARREVYLCNKLNCNHKNYECTAVLPKDMRDGMEQCVLFGDDDYLYLMMEMPYSSGGMAVSGAYEESDAEHTYEEQGHSSLPPVIYRMKKDGTEREKVYTFDSGISVGDTVLTDGKYFYFVTLKQKEVVDGNSTYASTYDRQLISVDMEEKTVQTLRSLGDRQEVAGCNGREIVFRERDFGREITEEFQWTHEKKYEKLYQNSKEVYSAYNIDTGKTTVVKEIKNNREHSEVVHKGHLYITCQGKKEIEKVDLKTKKKERIRTAKSFDIEDVLISAKECEDVLLCWNWDSDEDGKRYLVNTKSGDVEKSILKDRYGDDVVILSQSEKDMFVIHDCRKNGADNVAEYFYSMITKEDFLNNKSDYKPVKMIYTAESDLY